MKGGVRSAVLRGLLYLLFGLLATVVITYLNLPDEAIAKKLSYEIGRALGRKTEIGRFSAAFPAGVVLENVKIFKKNPEEDAETPPLAFFGERIELDLRLLPLLKGEKSFHLDATLYGGDLQGDYTASGSETALSLVYKDIRLDGLLNPSHTESGLDVEGVLRGRVDLKSPVGGADFSKPGEPWENLGKLNGKITAAVSDGKVLHARFNDLPVPGMAGFSLEIPSELLPTFSFDSLKIDYNIVNGEATAEKFEMTGRDLNLEFQGKSVLRSPFDSTTLKYQVRITPFGKLKETLEPMRGFLNQSGPGGYSLFLDGLVKSPRVHK